MSPAPTLLLLHGVGDSGACWGPFVTALRERVPGLIVRTPNAPAHGGRRSEPGHTVAFEDQLVEAIAHAQELVAERGGPIVVGGHSMGSGTALAVAAQRPDLVSGLWLEDPPLFTSMAEAEHAPTVDSAVALTVLRDWFADLQSIPLEQAVAGATADHPDWDPAEYEPWARAQQSVDVAAFSAPVDFVVSDWPARVRAVRCPVVVAAGRAGEGSILSTGAEQDLAQLPNWSITRLPTGHDVRRDAPATTADLLAGLIRATAG